MTFTQTLTSQLNAMFPMILIWLLGPIIPFILLEQIQLRRRGLAPRVRDYTLNVSIALTTAFLSLPFGILAGLWSARLRELFPWKPFAFSFDRLDAVPFVGPALEILAMIFLPLVLHDLWFYWAHRIEHRVPLLWAFHRIHHSDERMNTTTWARDHFLQTAWRSFFPVFTLGVMVDLSLAEAGQAAFYSSFFLMMLSLFYHSALRVRLPWLDGILVTPQVHRIHHGADPEYYNRNFADALPILDILFGTYRRPGRDEFPETGLGAESPAPRSVWGAQVGPLLAVLRMVLPESRYRRAKQP